MMWIRGVILLIALSFVPSVICRLVKRNEASTEDQTDRTTASSNANRRFKKTHLHIEDNPPQTLQVQEGDSKFLECRAGGIPGLEIYWLKDGVISRNEESQENQEIVAESNGTNSRRKIIVNFMVSRLYLDCLTVEDQGEYSCVAENPYHRLNASTQITVSSTDEEINCEKKSHEQAPRITQWTKNTIRTLGETAQLSCRVEGYPRPTIRWLGVNDEELTADFSKFQVLPEGDLIVHQLLWADMGIYTCIAENVHGEAKEEAFLYPTLRDN